MGDEAASFQVGERTFALSPLKVKAQLRAEILLLPILAGLRQGITPDVFASLERLPELVDIYAAKCTVTWEGRTMPLAPILDNVFARKPTALLTWVAECTAIELGDFLSENGQSLIAGLANRFASLKK